MTFYTLMNQEALPPREGGKEHIKRKTASKIDPMPTFTPLHFLVS